MDSNLPEATFTAVELVLSAAERVVQENLAVTPDDGVSSFEVDGDRLLVPGFGRLGERLFHAAVAGGPDDPTITAYLDSVLDFAAGDGPRLEKLRLRRQATGVYPTTEGEILEARGPSRGHLSREEGLRLVLWACDRLEDQISPP
jgi:carboxylate-amine ligase